MLWRAAGRTASMTSSKSQYRTFQSDTSVCQLCDAWDGGLEMDLSFFKKSGNTFRQQRHATSDNGPVSGVKVKVLHDDLVQFKSYW